MDDIQVSGAKVTCNVAGQSKRISFTIPAKGVPCVYIGRTEYAAEESAVSVVIDKGAVSDIDIGGAIGDNQSIIVAVLTGAVFEVSRIGLIKKHISIDKGVVDIIISEGGKRIEYRGGGLKTDAGQRIPSPTTGMSIPAVGVPLGELEMESADLFGEASNSRRPRARKKLPRRGNKEERNLIAIRGIR